MNVSEMQFKAPPASLSPQMVLWMKSALLVGCVTSAGTWWEPRGSMGDSADPRGMD